MLEALGQDQIDVLTTIEKDYPLKSNSNIAITKPVLIVPYVLVGKSDAEPVGDIKALFGKKVAVVKGYAQDKHLHKYPQIQRVYVRNNEAGFEAVREGRAEYYLNNRANAEYVIYKEFSPDLKIAGELPGKDFPPLTISFGVFKGKPELVSIINKGIENIHLETIKRLNRRWLGGGLTEERAIQVGEEEIRTAAKRREMGLTPKETAFILKHPKIVLGGDKTWGPFTIPNEDGSVSGYDADIISQINELTGLNITFELGKWKDITQKAQKGGLDGLTTSSVQKERAEYLKFSDPYFELRKIVFVKNGNPKNIHKAGDLYGKRFGVERGNLQMEKTAKSHEAGKLVYYDNTVGLVKGLVAGEIDVFIGNDVTMYQAIKEGLISYIEPAFLTGESLNLVFSFRKEWPELVSIANKALRYIDRHNKQEILSRWFGEFERNRPTVFLTDEEQRWLDDNPEATIAMLEDAPPFSYVENGRHKGFELDLLALISGKTGLHFKPVYGTWSSNVNNFKSEKVDLISRFSHKTEREPFTLFTKPYYVMPTVIYVRDDFGEYTGLNSLEGKRIGLLKDVFYAKELKKYGDMELVEYGTPEEISKALVLW